MLRVLEQILYIFRDACVCILGVISKAATFAAIGAIGAIGKAATFVDGYVKNEQLRAIMHGAIAMANRLMDEVSVVMGTFSLYDSAYASMQDAVPTAKQYMQMAVVTARTFSFYDWVFYFVCAHVVTLLVTCVLKNGYNKGPTMVLFASTGFAVACSCTSLSFYERMFYYFCFIVVMNMLEKVNEKYSMCSFLYGVYYMPSTMLGFFATTAFSAACTAMSRVASDEHNTNVVFNWVSTKARELGALMLSPYVYMYTIYMYSMVMVKLFVEFLFDTVVSVCRASGRMIWWSVGILPVLISQFVTSTSLCAYRALVAKMSNTVPFCQMPFWFRVCFHVIHTIFIVAVHTWTLYTLQAYWTQTASPVL